MIKLKKGRIFFKKMKRMKTIYMVDCILICTVVSK